MANFVPCFRECFDINAAITKVGDCLLIPGYLATKICKKLGSEGYTFMIANMPDGSWVQVKLQCVPEDTLQVAELKPGIPGDSVPTIPAGTELYFDWTADAWQAMHECVTGTDEEAAEAECEELVKKFKSDYFDIKCVEGKICIEPKPDPDGETPTEDKYWEFCNTRFFVDKDGTVKCKPSPNPIADQTMDPVKVIMKNGKPEFMPSSCPPIEKPECDPCIENQKGN